MISAIALFGIAWLTATFIAAHEEYIVDTIGGWVTDWKFLFALAVFLVAALTTSQSTATRTIVPIGLAAGLPPASSRACGPAAWAASTPCPPTARRSPRRTSTSRAPPSWAPSCIDHSFFIPMLVALGDHHRRRRRHRRGLLLSPRTTHSLNSRPERSSRCRRKRSRTRRSTSCRSSSRTWSSLVVDPLGRLPRLPARAGHADGRARPCRCSGTSASTNAQLMDVPTRLPAHLRRDPGPGGLASGDALRALRRPAGPAGAGLDDRPVDRRRPRPTAGSTAAAPPTTRAGWRSTWAPCGSSTASPPARSG